MEMTAIKFEREARERLVRHDIDERNDRLSHLFLSKTDKRERD